MPPGEHEGVVPDPLVEVTVRGPASYNGGQPIDMTEPLRLFPMELTSVRAYARRMLGS